MSYIIEIGTKSDLWLSDDNSITRSREHAIPFSSITACNIKITKICEMHRNIELRIYKIMNMETNELVQTLYSSFGFPPKTSFNENQLY